MRRQKLIIAAAALIALVALLGGLYAATRPDTTQGKKTITVEVVHRDASSKVFTYETDAEYLGEVLLTEGLILGEEGPYGMYISEVDGERAVYEEDHAFWALYQGENYASTGVDQTPIADGDTFALVYTPA